MEIIQTNKHMESLKYRTLIPTMAFVTLPLLLVLLLLLRNTDVRVDIQPVHSLLSY